MKWWAICTNLPVDALVRIAHPWSGDSKFQEMFLQLPADKQARNYDIEFSNHHPSLSNLTPNGLSRRKMKWWAIYTNLPVDVRVRLLHHRSGDRQGQERFLAPSDYEQIRNYDTECSNHHPSLSTLSANELSRSKMKWLAIHTNLPVDVIVRLSHPRSGDSRNQETFWAPTAEKQTRNYHIECSNHLPSLSTQRPKGLIHSKMKWWEI